MSHKYDNAPMPRMEAFIVSEYRPSRNTVYGRVYEKLLELAQLNPPQGANIVFPTKSASDKAIKTLNDFANEDGYYITYYPYEPGDDDGPGSRRFHLTKVETEDVQGPNA